ncbi:hypothetical protein [Providencia rettgeri]|uniref:hypothetical protein n=1 Tax=Providencia rettgeri TaxID=587 RepID=UPI00301683B8
MIVSERTPINGKVYPFNLLQKFILSAFAEFVLSQTFDCDNGPHSHNPAIKNQGLNAFAKALGFSQYSAMTSVGKKHQQQTVSDIPIVDHPNFLTLFPLHYAEAMGPHVSKTLLSNSNFRQFLKELTTKQLRFRLRKNANGTFDAVIAAENEGWYPGWVLQLPKLALTSRVAFFTVILQWYHTLINMGYEIDFSGDFVFDNSQLLNVSCPADLIQELEWYQSTYNSILRFTDGINVDFAKIDKRLNDYIRQQNIPYDFERFGEISLRTHVIRLNETGLVVPNAYFNSEKLRKPQPMDTRPIVLMDICTIKFIAKHKNIQDGKNKVMQERVRQLKALVEKGYRFSFLLVIIEKATDYQNIMSADELIARTIKDYELIVDFIGEKNIVESPLVIQKMVSAFMDKNYVKEERAELSIPNCLKLLEFFNGLGITNTPAASQRFTLAEQVANEGERLGLSRGYPAISMCIASIYECIDARKVLKVSKDGSFNSSNCLGDVMSFYRVAKAKSVVNRNLGNVDVIFRTEDLVLENLHQYITVTEISRSDGTSTFQSQFPHPEKLFPKLYKNGICINEPERDKLFALLNFKVD